MHKHADNPCGYLAKGAASMMRSNIVGFPRTIVAYLVHARCGEFRRLPRHFLQRLRPGRQTCRREVFATWPLGDTENV